MLLTPYIALLCVCEGLTLHKRNLAWEPPCSVEMYLGTGNLMEKTILFKLRVV